jgi:hypothetical protein
MTAADATLPTGLVARKLAFTAVGVVLFVASLTVVFEAMRSVMDVGGYCASGGPYEIRQECPGGTWLLPVGIFTGLAGVGLVAAGTFARGPNLWSLAWPALFLALGWNFLRYGIDPPPPEDGPVWGWLVCAVAFIAMGGIPLLFIVLNAKSVLWGSDDAPGRSSRRPSSPSTAVPFGTTTVVASPPPPKAARPDDDDDDLVSDLERLAALHRSGALSDDEYARAKTARLDEEDA